MTGINVGLRFRPILKKESEKNVQWNVNNNFISSKNEKYKFSFANIFDETATNDEIYTKLGRPIVKKFLAGYNGTILTFGQTSSGKTHTMVGNHQTPGIIEMAIDDILHGVSSSNDNYVKLRVGYIEVYNEKIFDLLGSNGESDVETKRELKIFELKGEAMTNQKQFDVQCKDDIMRYFYFGNRCKRMGQSIVNDNSSRSHTIFRINLESSNRDGNKKSSNLFLVDLAGSEKPDMSKNSFNEGLFINKSLLALGKIVRQLSEKNVDVKKLRYRDSLLTRLLSSALGGNSFTSMICTLSPTSLDETFYTICFAQNAERAKCKPKLNTTSNDSKEVKMLREEVKRLQNELELTKSAIFDETFETSGSTIIRDFSVINLEESCNRKRNRNEESFCEDEKAPKIFIQTIELPSHDVEKLRSLEEENKELKWKLMEIEKKNVNLIRKNNNLTDILFKKKLQLKSWKRKFTQQQNEEKRKFELISMHKNLIISCLENELQKTIKNNQKSRSDYDAKIMEICDDFNGKINEKNEQISVLSQAVRDQNFHGQDFKASITILQNQLTESSQIVNSLNDENNRLRTINESLKKSFKASLKNTREQFNDLLQAKQQQAIEFRQQINEIRNEELRCNLKIQEHYEKLYRDLNSQNETFNMKILKLQMDLEERDETITNLKNRYEKVERIKEDTLKHEHEKIKFIKQHFQMKLIDKTNQMKRMFKAKEAKFTESMMGSSVIAN